MVNTNIGNAFPLEKLDSDLSRNNYNYQSILTGLINWNNTSDDYVHIRLTKDSDPWYEDYIIPSKKSTLSTGTFTCDVKGSVNPSSFYLDHILNCVVSTADRKFITETFNADSYTSIHSSDILLGNADEFSIGDLIRFDTITGTIPSAISAHQLYYIISKIDSTIKVSTTATGSAIILLDGSGDILIYKFESQPDQNSSDGDIVTFRVTVNSTGASSWRLYYAPLIYSYISGVEYKACNYIKNGNVLYRTIFDTIPTDLITYTNKFRPVIHTWVYGSDYYVGDIVINPSGDAYTVLVDVKASILDPITDPYNYELYAKKWISGTDYVKGSYVYHSGLFYISNNDIISSNLYPNSDTSNWDSDLLFRVNTSGIFSSSTLIRWKASSDTSKFYMKNESNALSDYNTDIHIQISVKNTEYPSIYQRSVGILSTSNFVQWPDNATQMWIGGTTYGPTDISIPITKRQDYSAIMIFDHTKMKTSKTVNYINYDGPDLDQGLCVYLPVEIDIGDNGIAYPEDGFTYEFFLRIWPNSILNGKITRDHTVNKSQIYIYSALNRDGIDNDICEQPIAKLSMARSTNFYMFGENVSIPDKPVCYRVTVVYSHAEKRWMVIDYYQLPDHIFVGPIGFIDPQSPANMDINNDVIGNINPNASFIGYETAAFPLFQDPFSNADLTPYRIQTDDDYDKFINRSL